MQTTTRPISLRWLGGATLSAVLLTGCSGDRLVETALERVDGVESVDIDADSGSISLDTQDGEVSLEFDESGDGSSTITTPEGTVETTVGGELPAAVIDAITLPDTFVLEAVQEIQAEGGSGIALTGTVSGALDELLADLTASATAAGWPEAEATVISEQVYGGVFATDPDNGASLSITIILDDEQSAEGMLQLVLNDGSAG